MKGALVAPLRTRPTSVVALLALVALLGLLAVLPEARPVRAARPDPPLHAFALLDATAPAASDVGRWKSTLADARRRGARYALLPQLAVEPQAIPGPLTEDLARVARELDLWVAFSLPERGVGGHHLTSVLLDNRGALAVLHRQVIVPTQGGVVRGSFRDTVETVDVHGFRLGIVAAEDAQTGVPRLADRGADAILISVSSADADGTRADLLRKLGAKYRVSLIVGAPPDPGGSPQAPSGSAYDFQGQPVALHRERGFALASVSVRPLPWRIPSALGLPASVPLPGYRPPAEAEADLGRRLFFEKALSATGAVSCATCHDPLKAFAGDTAKGTGVHDRHTKRNVPSLLNVAFRPLLQWDGYASSIENFVKYPINGFTEMGSHYLDRVVPYLREHAEYAASFRQVMGAEPLEFEHVARALATYQRTLISGNSAFDRYAYGGDRDALAPDARRGYELFVGRADCSRCHLVGDRYALFSDLKYHDLGVGYRPELAKYDDIGLGGISTDDSSGLFQTPSLRNVARTAPYMHDGSLATLEEVVEFHDRGGQPSPHRDPALRPLGLSAQEKRDLVAFLRALSGDEAYAADGRRLATAAPTRQAGN